MNVSYSKLVNLVRLSPNCTKPRGHKIDAIVIHHMAEEMESREAESAGYLFADPTRYASSNYGIGSDGTIACYVEEENAAWTSSNGEIDNRAITIEVANCGGDPDWPVSDKALEATIELCVDVCRRYGFKLNYTGDKTGNLHMHKWYAPTLCPGPYLESKFPYIEKEVNARLRGETKKDVFYRVQCGAFNERKNAEVMRDNLRKQGYKDAFIVEVERN